MKPRGSIAWRLAIALSGGLAVIWLGAVAIGTGTMQGSLNLAFDEALRQSAFRLLQLAVAHGESPLPPVLGLEDNEEYLTYIVLDASGEVILRAADAPAALETTFIPDGFSELDARRVFRYRSPHGNAIVVVELTDHRAEAIAGSVAALVWPLLALVPLMALGSWYAVRVAMRPVFSLSSDISRRSGSNLAPLSARGYPRDLAPIADAVDSLLERLRAALDAERAFAASSAHELRTPIAGALAQTQLLSLEVASGPGAERIKGIEAALRKLSQLSERLLQLARLDAGFALSEEMTDLLPALQVVVDDFRASPAGARVRLSIDPEVALLAPITLDAFEIAVRNLIENGLVHGDQNDAVEIIAGPGAILKVTNRGPRLSSATIASLSRPFARGPGTRNGTGIGLSIVRSIIEQTNGTLTLRSPASGRSDGFEASLSWK